MYAKPRNNEETPVTSESKDRYLGESVTTHPAFAQIGASRVSGRTNLYDSEFQHNNYMTITIRRSSLHRGHYRDRHYGDEEYIQVALSESQWATFVSSPNQGTGVPCTMTRRNGETIPGIPALDKSAVARQEIREELDKAIQSLNEALAAVDELGLSAKKAETIKAKIKTSHKILNDSIPYATEQFEEHMETVVERGKAEVHGYINNAIHRAGLESLNNNDAPIQIEG